MLSQRMALLDNVAVGLADPMVCPIVTPQTLSSKPGSFDLYIPHTVVRLQELLGGSRLAFRHSSSKKLIHSRCPCADSIILAVEVVESHLCQY